MHPPPNNKKSGTHTQKSARVVLDITHDSTASTTFFNFYQKRCFYLPIQRFISTILYPGIKPFHKSSRYQIGNFFFFPKTLFRIFCFRGLGGLSSQGITYLPAPRGMAEMGRRGLVGYVLFPRDLALSSAGDLCDLDWDWGVRLLAGGKGGEGGLVGVAVVVVCGGGGGGGLGV